MEIEEGYCQCGCGQKTNITPANDKNRGMVKGKPRQFIKKHHSKRENNPMWKGGKYKSSTNYQLILLPEHSRADSKGYVREHILIAEKALGKSLPLKAVVHHHTPDQLVICQDQAYHNILHQRQRAYESCGHANWRKCQFCQQYDDPKNLIISKTSSKSYHQRCNADYYINLYHAKKH